MISITKRVIFLSMGILVLSLTACSPSNNGIPVTGNTSTPVPTTDLANTNWRLISYGVPGSETPALAGTDVTLQFQSGGQAGGSGGCNSFGAHYGVTDGNNISITDLISTLRACNDQAVMDQETQYFDALRSASSFEISGDQLIIYYENGQKVLDFSRSLATTPAPSPTSTPVPVPTPTLTAIPTATQGSASAPERIEFAPGATSATLTGQLAASGSQEYILYALGGQTMSVDLNFTQGAAILSIWGQDGQVLLTDHAEVSNFRRVLPSTQDYHIRVEGRPDGPTTYSMTVAISSLASGPERIDFAQGATSATVEGQLAASGLKEYVLHALGGQTMTVDLSFTEGSAILAVWGEDGQVLLTDHAGVSHFHGVLPTTQDYHILVRGRPEGRTVYSMTVSIPSPTTGLKRITFAPGTTTSTLTGELPASGSDQYVIHALAGQTMNIDLHFNQGKAILVVWGADGNVLLSDHAEASSFRHTLPTTQDYYILVKGRPEGGTSYMMTVFVPPL